MGRRARSLLGVLVLAGIAVPLVASPTLACISESPSFVQAVARADVIARVTIVDGTDYGGTGDIEVFRVERVLKGTAGTRIELANPITGLCHDRIGASAGGPDDGVGQSIVLATNVEFFDQVIHPFWIQVDGGVSGTAGSPPGVDDMAQLEAAILRAARVPDTSTASPADPATEGVAPGPAAFVLVAAFISSAVVARRRFRPSD